MGHSDRTTTVILAYFFCLYIIWRILCFIGQQSRSNPETTVLRERGVLQLECLRTRKDEPGVLLQSLSYMLDQAAFLNPLPDDVRNKLCHLLILPLATKNAQEQAV